MTRKGTEDNPAVEIKSSKGVPVAKVRDDEQGHLVSPLCVRTLPHPSAKPDCKQLSLGLKGGNMMRKV